MTHEDRTGRLAGGVVCLGLMLVLAAACSRRTPDGQPETSASSHSVQGCWDLELSTQGTRLDSVRAWLPAGSLPTVVGLDSARIEGDDDQPIYRARSYVDGGLEAGPFSAWRPLSGDSILVDRPGALAGFALRLAPDDDGGLSGILSSFTDVVQPDQPSRRTTPVRATRASCPSDGSGAAAASAG